jgi:ribosome-binding factor A
VSSSLRNERVAEQIRQNVSELIQNEVKDRRVGFTTVTRVKVTADLRSAIIFCSVLGSEKEKRDTLVGLKQARGFVRTQVGERLKLRFTPKIEFALDESLDHSFHISKILQKIKEEDHGERDHGSLQSPSQE